MGLLLMRKLIFLLLVCVPLVICMRANAYRTKYIRAGSGPSASTTTTSVAACVTSADSEAGAAGVDHNLFRFSGRDYYATAWTTGSQYNLCKVEVILTATGTPTMNVTMYIYTDDAGENDPALLHGGGGGSTDCTSDAVASDAGWDETAVAFTNMDCQVSNATRYWIVLGTDGTDSSNYLTWEGSSSAPASDEIIVWDSDASGEWADVSTAEEGLYETYE